MMATVVKDRKLIFIRDVNFCLHQLIAVAGDTQYRVCQIGINFSQFFPSYFLFYFLEIVFDSLLSQDEFIK
jgi:hypothetical protein